MPRLMFPLPFAQAVARAVDLLPRPEVLELREQALASGARLVKLFSYFRGVHAYLRVAESVWSCFAQTGESHPGSQRRLASRHAPPAFRVRPLSQAAARRGGD
jgi:hypothetical protein